MSQQESKEAGMTAMAGLPVYLDLASVLGVGDCIGAHVHVRGSDQGWTDEQAVLSLILLNLAGGTVWMTSGFLRRMKDSAECWGGWRRRD